MTNSIHKHSHCYPEVIDGKLQSKNVVLHNKSDVRHTCMCTLSELCGALTTMLGNGDKESKHLIGIIHRMTDEQKDLVANQKI